MATKTKDYYELLGVARTSTPEQIRKAYLKLAHRYHPDKTGGNKAAEDKLKQINEAYDTLKNAEKRRAYDAMLNTPFGEGFQGGPFGQGAGPFGQGGGSFTGFDFGGAGGGFEDLLGSLFGGRMGRARSGPQPGRDLENSITLSFEESARGAVRKLRVARRDACGTCRGTGAAPGSKVETCPACQGTGVIQRNQGMGFSLTQPCGRCRGRGSLIAKPCARCHGSGFVEAERELNVTIPAGLEAGARLRLAGEGEPATAGGPHGDLYVQVNVAPSEFFTRQGLDLVCEVPVPFPVAALGGTVRVPTLTGTAGLKVPSGTQTGAVLRMRGLGIHHPKTGVKGDQLVRVTVEVPASLTREERELVKKMADPANMDRFPEYQRFRDRMRRSRG